jgi:TPR repeat protein
MYRSTVRNITSPEERPAPADAASETTLLTYEAALGDADAEMDIARTYYHGELGHEVDFDRARQLFERHPDDPEALVYLGKMYHIGEGVPIDLDKTAQYYRRAAEMNNADGMNCLGVLKQTTGDAAGGAELIEKAAAHGHLTAMFNVAMAKQEQGLVEESIEVLRSLAMSDVIVAQLRLAQMLVSLPSIFDEREAFDLVVLILEEGP